jgi:phage terminase large subunit-like protein
VQEAELKPARSTKKKKTSSSVDRCTAYARAVTSGEIIAGPHVRNACRRHLDDLKRGHERGLHYDVAAAERVWKFFETKLCLNGGQFEGQPFLLHPSQAFKLGCLFGWKRADGTRRFRRAYIEEGKGNGKSPFAAGVGLYGMMADGEAGAEIYSLGAHRDQAAILFRDGVKMVDQSPDLAKRVTKSGGPGREFNLAWIQTGSFFRPMSRDAGKTGSGLRPHFGLADELHEHPTRDAIEMLEAGFKFRRQPLLLMITNSGTDRNSICWEEHEHAIRVAAGNREAKDDDAPFMGEPIDDDTFSFVCGLDADDDPLNDPSCWVKANPLLGTILQPDYLEKKAMQAKELPGKRNGILRLNFCQWTDAQTSWISRELLEQRLDDFNPAEFNEVLAAGLDLSGRNDLTAAAFVAADGLTEDGKPKFAAWVEAFTPEQGIKERGEKDRAPYQAWVDMGQLNATPGPRVGYEHVAKVILDVHEASPIGVLAYDNYAFDKFREAADAIGLVVPEMQHPQAGRKRAKTDDGELGLWMPGSINTLEELLTEGRLRLKRNPVLISAMMSAVLESDPLENRWFAKRKATQRIDAVVALAMAIGAATLKASPSIKPAGFVFF